MLLLGKRYFSSSTAATVVVRRSPGTEDIGNARTRMEEFDSYLKKLPCVPK